MKRSRIALAAVTAAIVTGEATVASADPIETFYSGKRLKIVVGAPVGGGYDLYSRLLARHIGKHIPGQPSVMVVNMPGAVSVNAANYLANIAPQDGTESLTVVQTISFAQVAGGPNIHFDLARFQWLGSMSDDANVFVAWHTADVKSIEDVRNRELVVGATNLTAIGALYPAVMNRFMGTRFKIVLGYKSGDAVDLAMERGEVDGRAGASWSSLKSMRAHRLRDKEINIFLQIGLRKEPDLIDVPLLIDLARNNTEQKVLQFYSSLTAVARALAVAPGVPAERVAALRRAFDETMHDPALLADAAKQSIDIRPIEGRRLQDIVTDMVHTDPTILQLDAILGGR
jgi:tripartite-type tricarboxylate transporter receptor subunit TctC